MVKENQKWFWSSKWKRNSYRLEIAVKWIFFFRETLQWICSEAEISPGSLQPAPLHPTKFFKTGSSHPATHRFKPSHFSLIATLIISPPSRLLVLDFVLGCFFSSLISRASVLLTHSHLGFFLSVDAAQLKCTYLKFGGQDFSAE